MSWNNQVSLPTLVHWNIAVTESQSWKGLWGGIRSPPHPVSFLTRFSNLHLKTIRANISYPAHSIQHLKWDVNLNKMPPLNMALWPAQISIPLCNCFLCLWRLNISLALFLGQDWTQVQSTGLTCLATILFDFVVDSAHLLHTVPEALRSKQDTVLWGLANVKQRGQVTSQTLQGMLLCLDSIVVFFIFTATWRPISSSRLLSEQLFSVFYSIAVYSSLTGVSCPCPYLFLISF